MKDHRRDQTAQIPAATLEELAASQRKLAKRDITLVGVASVPEDPPISEGPVRVVCQTPKEPIRREELEAALGEQLKPFPLGCQEAFLRKFSARSYAAATALLDEAAKLQPRNLTMAKAASAVRHFALARLEVDLGALHAIVRAVKPLPMREFPSSAVDMLAHVDGKTSIESLVRSSKLDRLVALGLLADLARSEHIELRAPSARPNVSMRLPPIPSASGALLEDNPKVQSERPRERASVRPRESRSERPVAADPVRAEVIGLERLDARPSVESPAHGAATQASRELVEQGRLDAPPAPAASPPPASPLPAPPLPASPLAPPLPPSPARSRTRVPLLAVIGMGVALSVGLIVVLLSRTPDPDASTLGRQPSAQASSTSKGAGDPAPLPPQTVAPSSVAPAPSAAEHDGAMATMVVRIKAEPRYARVTLDGVLLTKAPIEVTIPKDGAQHDVTIEAPGFRPKKMTFVADANVSIIASLDLLAAKATPARSASPAPAASAGRARGR